MQGHLEVYEHVLGYLGELHNYVNELESRLGNLEGHLGELEGRIGHMEGLLYDEREFEEDEIEECANEQDSDLFDCPVCGNQPNLVMKGLGGSAMYATYDCTRCMIENDEYFVVLDNAATKEEWNDYVVTKAVKAARKEIEDEIKNPDINWKDRGI